MKQFSVLFILPIFILLAGCSQPQRDIPHSGIKDLNLTIGQIDTISIDDEYLSGQYNAFLFDSCIVFADKMQNTLSFYNLTDGSLRDRRLGYGQGPKELISMLYAQPIQGAEGEIAILDASNGLFIYTPQNDSLNYKGIIDFNWGKGNRNDYNDIANYGVMEMSDFAISFAKRDTTLLVPLSIIGRNFDKVDERRYNDGHIFSNIDLSSVKASNPFGEFPKQYISRPIPFFEFFDFTVDEASGNIIYNFAPDSLIYISGADGTPIKSIGFEPLDVNRDYTIGYEADRESFKKDIQKVGVNTGLYLDSDESLLFRTSLHNFPSGHVTLQVYDSDGNLVLETNMPDYFKFLGKFDGYYYGTRFIPEEGDGENLSFPVYRFNIIPIEK